MKTKIGKNVPQWTTRGLLLLFLVGICGRGYGNYNQTLKNTPQVWADVVRGTANAPEQYRVGVVITAYWLSAHLHVKLSQAFGILDLLASAIAVMLLFSLLERTAVFGRASTANQWFGSAAFAGLIFYLLDWVNWYQKVSTLPTACFVALMLWIWTPSHDLNDHWLKRTGFAGLFLILIIAQSFIRADVALAVSLGIFLAAATRLSPMLMLPRTATLGCSLIAVLVALAVQFYLARILFPSSTYGSVHPFMLLHDWWRLGKWAYSLIFMAPFLWTLTQAVRLRYAGEGAGAAFLIAAVGYAGIWLVMGRLDEVRIFLPMALAITPLTVELGMSILEGTRPTKRVSESHESQGE